MLLLLLVCVLRLVCLIHVRLRRLAVTPIACMLALLVALLVRHLYYYYVYLIISSRAGRDRGFHFCDAP